MPRRDQLALDEEKAIEMTLMVLRTAFALSQQEAAERTGLQVIAPEITLDFAKAAAAFFYETATARAIGAAAASDSFYWGNIEHGDHEIASERAAQRAYALFVEDPDPPTH